MEEAKEDTPLEDSLSIVVIGASGDLAKKKTYPALYDLFAMDLLPKNTIIMGYARSALERAAFHARLLERLSPRGDEESVSNFLSLCYYHQGNYGSEEDFAKLHTRLLEMEATLSTSGTGNRLFYFAIPPKVFVDSARSLSASAKSPSGWTRVVVEKPFGRDAETSKELSVDLAKYLEESQIYRIDHYLGKEMVQNLLIMRFGNAIFEPLWNHHHVKVVQITFKEPFGTEGRGGYFDDIGIIRDVMQNHLLQVLSLVAMEPPVSLGPEDIRDEKVKVLRAIRVPSLSDFVIGQYGANAQGTKPGYLDDDGVPADSVTPTFATGVFHVDNPRWHGVPFILKCGKALNEQKVEIRIQFHQPPNTLFSHHRTHSNELVLRIQPNEAMWVKMNSKLPGLSSMPVETELDLSYKTRFPTRKVPEAYARLLLDVLRNDHAQFVRDDELAAAWAIFSPLLHEMETTRVKPHVYPYGSRGPPASDELIAKCGYQYDHRYSSKWRRDTASESFRAYKDEMTISGSRLLKLLNDFILEMERGLAGEESSIKMIPSYVAALPDGDETGDFFAIDLGGSNLRVVSISLRGKSAPPLIREHKEVIPDAIQKGSGAELFAFIANLVKAAAPPPGAKLGFTFSFPCAQTALDSGTLIHWTKGFQAAGVVDKDVVGLLRRALDDAGVDVEVSALVNDTVGTLMAKAYSDPRCRIGVILGTGTNGAYVERAAGIPKWTGSREGFQVINMEWGGFGSGEMGRSLLPVAGIDSKLDALSPNPTKQRYEKMISGMYLGELFRLSLAELTSKGVLEWGESNAVPAESILKHPWQFGTDLMARIAVDSSDSLGDIKEVFDTKCNVDTTHATRLVIKEVCECVAKRAARLAAVGVAGCVSKMGPDAGDCVAGIDGSVFLRYPQFSSWMREALTEIGVSCHLEEASDGSGLGAAVIASVATKSRL